MGNAGRNGGEYYTPRPLIQVVKPRIGERIYDGAAGSAGFLCEAYDYLLPKAQTTADREILQKRTFYEVITLIPPSGTPLPAASVSIARTGSPASSIMSI
jgi:hypothetical protein